jgi:hypothetical protein
VTTAINELTQSMADIYSRLSDMVRRLKPGYQFHINKTIKMKAKSMHMAYKQHAPDGQDRAVIHSLQKQ